MLQVMYQLAVMLQVMYQLAVMLQVMYQLVFMQVQIKAELKILRN